MTDTLVSFDTAILAKEKGFNIPEEIFISNEENYTTNFNIPTQSLLQKWLREVHKISTTVFSSSQESWSGKVNTPSIRGVHGNVEQIHYKGEDAHTYEESLEEVLQEGLKLIKNKEDE